MTDLAAVEAAITPATKIAVLRDARRTRGCGSPDIDALAALGHRHGLIVVADNTFLGPALLRPIEHGADLVLHAATKYLSGHGDAVSGVGVGPEGAARPDPQAGRHARPGGQPVRSFLVAARRPDAAAALGRGLARTPRRRALPRGASQGRVGPLPGPRLAPRPRRRDAAARRARYGAMLTFQLARRRRRAWPRSPTICALCDIGVSLGDVYTLVYPRPKAAGSSACRWAARTSRISSRTSRSGCRSSPEAPRAVASRSAARARPPRQRRADREVDAARHLVLGRAEPASSPVAVGCSPGRR